MPARLRLRQGSPLRHSTGRVLRRLPAAALLSGGVAALAAQAPAQKPQEADPQPPRFRTEANFVRVDVYPLAAGKPVTDLRREDFELLEDGRPQTIETFEYVRIGVAGPQAQRADPSSIEATRQAANPRSRIFVVFLDMPHVTTEGAKRIGPALNRFIDRALGPADLIGIMTPFMSAADIVLARKSQVVEGGLREGSWGQRFTVQEDDRETLYKTCYHVLQQEREQDKTVSDLARALIVRRREQLTLEALRELVVYLRGIREERKAILTISEGWTLFRPDPRITRLREECTCPSPHTRRELQDCNGCKPLPWKEQPPSADPIRVGRDGKLRIGALDTETGIASDECKIDRTRLASVDHVQFARDLAQDANRANATFYTIDPRGLAVFDAPLSSDPNETGRRLNAADDQLSLRQRHDALANLAAGTDGIALMNSNDLDGALRRIASDLSAYYLLGYYSTNARLDGRFRAITVRVKRPGIEIRARRGYRAPTEGEVAAARIAAAPPVPEPVNAIAKALATLTRLRSDARFRLHAVPSRGLEGGPVTRMWIAGELPPAVAGWDEGGTAAIEITGAGASGKGQIVLKPGERAFVTSIPLQGSASTVDVRARLTNPDATITPFVELLHVDLSPGPPQPLLYRRGLSTRNRLQPAADFQFSRTERARIELPIHAGTKPGQGRVLDKAGQDLRIPVTIGERLDPETGQRWLTADVILAPLGAGDYVVEVTAVAAGAEQRTLTAIRVTR